MNDYMETLLESVKQTGFSLESTVISKLENLSWTVISNRYYVDDQTSTPREIDQIAYKSELRGDVRYYYVLVISCKRSQKEDWVLFTRDISSSALNLEKFPTLLWTNEKILERKITEKTFGNLFKDQVASNNSLKDIHDIEKVVFAFQQFDKKTANPKNDTDIYNSIISTVKAAEYEIRSLPTRKSDPCCYFFNLVSIFDGKLYEAYHGNTVELAVIHNATYINRLIVNGKDRHYKVNFIDLASIDQFLATHESCRVAVVNFLSGLRSSFYTEILRNANYLNLFLKEAQEKLNWSIAYALSPEGESNVGVANFYYFEKEKTLHVEVNSFDSEVLEKLNSNEKLRKRTTDFLKERYRYEGKFVFYEYFGF